MDGPTSSLNGVATPPSGFDAELAGLKAQESTAQTFESTLQTEQQGDIATAETERAGAMKTRAQGDAYVSQLEEQLRQQFPHDNPPQYNIGHLMQTAPIFMMMAALTGTRGTMVGTAGISAINGMMSGLIKGDQTQYEQAQKDYREKFAEWKQYSANIKSIIAEHMRGTNNTSLDQMRASQAAMRAAGAINPTLEQAHRDVINIHKAATALEESHRKNEEANNARKVRDSEMEKDRLARRALASKKYEDQVAKAEGTDLDKIATHIRGDIATLRKEYELKPMPPEAQQQLSDLKKSLNDATAKRLHKDQPKPQANKPATPSEKQAWKSQATQAVRIGTMSVDEARKRLKAAGVDDWEPPFATEPGAGKVGAITRQ